MMPMLRAGGAVAIALFLAACSASSGSGGTAVIGSFAGQARTGNAASASIVAAMGGGLVGSIAPQLDNANRRAALEAEYRALEYAQGGQPVVWSGASGVSGEVTAYQPYRVGSQDCRHYAHRLTHDGAEQTARGTACRSPDGSWSPLV